MKIVPRDYQRTALDCIISELREKASTLVDISTGCGKSLANSEPVLTPFGFRPMGGLRAGDYAVGRDGKPTRIVGVYPQGRLSVFRVTFDDGTFSRCSADHLWAVQTRGQKFREQEWKVLTVTEIRESIGKGWYVPVAAPWVGYAKPVPIDPYLLGVLIGDGSLTQCVVFSSADAEIIEWVRRASENHSPRLSLKKCGKYDYRITTSWKNGVNRLRNDLGDLRLRVKSEAKFIPAAYKTASRLQRVELLRGLMDADGSCGKSGGAEFGTSSRRLAEDVAELVRSLGGVTSVRQRRNRPTYHYKGEGRLGKVGYRVTVNTSDNPFRLARKADRYAYPLRSLTKRIVSVEPDGEEECTCIKVDAADSLFLTRSFIVTHNTYLFAWLCMLLGGRCLVLVHRDELKRQAIEKILRVCPDIGVTIEQGEARGDTRRSRNLFDDHASEVVVASKDTLCRQNRLKRYRKDDFDWLIVDEAHRVVRKNESYAAILRHFCAPPVGTGKAKLIGVSASLDRLDKEALGGIFQSVAYRYSLSEAIRDGYLLEPRVKRAHIKGVKLLSLPTKRDPDGRLEISLTALDRVMANREYAYGIAKPLLEVAGDNRQGVVFCSRGPAAEIQAAVLNAERRGCAALCLGEPYQSAEERKAAQDRLRAKDVQFLVTCDVLCLDSQTQILTESGWVGIGDMTYQHRVANYIHTREDSGSIYFKEPKFIIERDRLPGENMVSAIGPRHNIRVTADHRMLWKTAPGAEYHIRLASEIVGRRGIVPVSGVANPIACDLPDVPKMRDRKVAIVKSSYVLRKQGYMPEDANTESARRFDARSGREYTAARNMTLDDCRFVGFYLAEGSKTNGSNGGVEYTVAQSMVYENVITWFTSVLSGCGLHYQRREYPARGDHGVIVWSLARGTSADAKPGLFRLEPWLNKDGSALLTSLDSEQWWALIEGFWYGDGLHGLRHLSRDDSVCLTNTNKSLLDWIQAVSVCRGFRCTIGRAAVARKVNHKPLYKMTIRRVSQSMFARQCMEIELDWKPERVWCVTSDTGNIVTRRNGVVVITGNSEGWDYDGCEIVVLKPSHSRNRVAQMAGRATRPLDGCVDVWDTAELRREAIAHSPKPWCTLIDPCGASEEHSLLNVTDIFAGKFSASILKREPPKPTSKPDDTDERRAMRRALAEIEEEKLAGLSVEVDYEILDTEMMSEPERKAGAVSRARLSHPATENQCQWLEGHGFRVPAGMTKREASDAIGSIRARLDAGPATPGQRRLLLKLRQNYNVTRGEASARLDELLNPNKAKANEQPPEEES